MNATKDWDHRWDMRKALVTSDDSARALVAAAEYRVGYLVVTPALFRTYPETNGTRSRAAPTCAWSA